MNKPNTRIKMKAKEEIKKTQTKAKLVREHSVLPDL